MAKISALQTRLDGIEERTDYTEKLIKNLGDPSQYEYTGIVNDSGKECTARCACTHPIRYEYIIEHKITKKKASVGSTCINHFAEVNPKLYAALIAAAADNGESYRNIGAPASPARVAQERPLLIMFLQNHCNDWEKVTTCLARHNLGKLETASVLIAANLIELF